MWKCQGIEPAFYSSAGQRQLCPDRTNIRGPREKAPNLSFEISVVQITCQPKKEPGPNTAPLNKFMSPPTFLLSVGLQPTKLQASRQETSKFDFCCTC